MKNSIPEILNLSVFFREKNGLKVAAVDSLNISIERGSFLSLVGESGSGKTVTAMSVCRLLAAAEIRGEIRYLRPDLPQADLLKISAKELTGIRGRRIAYVFQEPGSSLNPVMKVGEQIREAHQAHFKVDTDSAKKKTLDLLASVRIRDAERVYESFPHELSGGMKQRAMIAMALILEPDLLIADEPTTALDPGTALEIMELLVAAQKRRGLSVLFITPHIAFAARFSDSLAVMKSGRIVEKLTKTGENFTPKEEYTRKLFRADLKGLAPKTRIEI